MLVVLLHLRPVTAQTEDVVVVDGLLRPADVVFFRDELDRLRAHHRAVPERVCTLRAHEHTCLVNTSASVASRVRATLDAALRIRAASSTGANEQKALPVRITFGPVHAHRDSAWVRQRLPTNALELGLDETDRVLSAATAYSVVVYLGGDGALVVGDGDSAREIEVVPGRLVAFPNHRLLHSAYGSMRQLLGPFAYIPGNHKNALWPTGNSLCTATTQCADGVPLPCYYGGCTWCSRTEMIAELGMTGQQLYKDGSCPTATGHLWLRNLGVHAVDENAFAGMASIGMIHLNNNELASLPSGVFRDCTSMTKLWISDSVNGAALRTLPSGLLTGLTSLTHFYASSAGIVSIPSGFFSGQGNLQQLRLQVNDLSCLPADVFGPLVSLT